VLLWRSLKIVNGVLDVKVVVFGFENTSRLGTLCGQHWQQE